MEIYTNTTKVTLMPDAAITPITPTMTIQAAPVRPVVIEARGRVHALATGLRPIEGSALTGAVSGSLPVFSGTTEFGTTDLCVTDLGSTAWGPPL